MERFHLLDIYRNSKSSKFETVLADQLCSLLQYRRFPSTFDIYARALQYPSWIFFKRYFYSRESGLIPLQAGLSNSWKLPVTFSQSSYRYMPI